MNNIQIKNFKGLVLPQKAHENDSGHDVVAMTDARIVGSYVERMDGVKMWSKIDFIEYDTQIQLQPQDKNIYTLVFPRSSISKYYLSLKNSVAVIDQNYMGSILLRFTYHFAPQDLVIVPEAGIQRVYGIIDDEKIFHKGDKLAQLIFTKTLPIEFQVVEKLGETERGSGGFGSSDAKQV
jgi:dUTP pyrophosphatase